MNKSDLIMAIAESADITKAKAEAAVNALMATITTELKEGGSVALTGFGTFQVRAREGANKSPNIKMRLCKYLNLIN